MHFEAAEWRSLCRCIGPELSADTIGPARILACQLPLLATPWHRMHVLRLGEARKRFARSVGITGSGYSRTFLRLRQQRT